VPHVSRRRHVAPRAIALLAATALAGAALVAAASPASASFVNGLATASVGLTPGTGCTTPVLPPMSSDGPIDSDGGSSALTASGSTTATKTGDLTDTTQLGGVVQGTASATQNSEGPRTIDVAATGSVSNLPALGAATACDSSASAAMSTTSFVTLTRPTLVDLRTSRRGGFGVLTTVVIASVGGILPSQVIDTSDQDGTSHSTILLPAGMYTFSMSAGMQRSTQDVIGTPSANFATAIHIDFRTPGEAPAGAKGAGTKYVTLPASLDCTGHSATVTYTKQAKPAKKPPKSSGRKKKPATLAKATFYVDGAVVKAAKKPDSGTQTVLSGISATDAVTIEAVVKVHGKGVVELRRTYAPCS